MVEYADFGALKSSGIRRMRAEFSICESASARLASANEMLAR